MSLVNFAVMHFSSNHFLLTNVGLRHCSKHCVSIMRGEYGIFLVATVERKNKQVKLIAVIYFIQPNISYYNFKM